LSSGPGQYRLTLADDTAARHHRRHCQIPTNRQTTAKRTDLDVAGYAVASHIEGGYWTEGYWKEALALDDRSEDGAAGATADRHGMVAHGLPVAISAPSVFRFTGLPGQIHDNLAAEKYSQDWRAECAMILQASTSTAASTTILSEKATRDQPGEALADELLELTNLLKVPIGIGSLGYTKTDVDALAVGHCHSIVL